MSEQKVNIKGSEVIFKSLHGGMGVFSVPETNYLVHADVPQEKQMRIGERLNGFFVGKGLRFHQAKSGGLFIEPMEGYPRVVAGRIINFDNERVLIKSVVMFCLELDSSQRLDDLHIGKFINGYVHSGIAFFEV